MDNNKPVAAIIGLLGALAGVVLCIVSAATNKWMTSDKDPSITVSIQEVCDEDGCITNEGIWRVGATLVIGIIKACIAVLLACIALCCMRQPENKNCTIRRLLLAGGILGILGALSVGIACLIFATADEDLRRENFNIALGYSFYLAVVGAVLIFIAAIVLLCARPPLQAVAVVFSMPPANVVAMQSTSVYGYDQGPINMAVHPQLPPSYYPPPAPAGYENERRFEKM